METPLYTRTVLGECSPDTFFLALSLVCDQRVEWYGGGGDYGDAGFLTRGMRSGLIDPEGRQGFKARGSLLRPHEARAGGP